ncbi:hypothetical protein GCM10023205_71080 [Yinghuangia aomiensis]|uniref:TrbC/VIRB2 family protein n=1 Tax=Yinghuangia aomiensis TaxID=676205 RepID=A0ABP9I7F0_9ACTN
MSGLIIHVSNHLFSMFPADGTGGGTGTGTGTNTPLAPSDTVDIGGNFMTKLKDLLGWARLIAWSVAGVSWLGVGGMMASSWLTGKGFQALGRAGWVAGGTLLIGGSVELVNAFLVSSPSPATK